MKLRTAAKLDRATNARRIQIPGHPAEYRPERVKIVIDIAEKLPWDMSPMRSIREHLTTGDYTVSGLEDCICCERKSLEDLVQCVGGSSRARFERELKRMLAYESRCVIVEAGWNDLERGGWRSKITPKAVVASILSWTSQGVPFILADNRERAQTLAARFLYLSARRQYRRCREFAKSFLENGD